MSLVVSQPVKLDPEEPLLSCDLQVDRPGAYAHNELVLSGWAVSPDGATGVIVDIDDRTLNASYGLDTPALAARMPEIPGAEHAGYFLRIDTSDWEPGPRQVTIATFDRKENAARIVGEVTIRPFEPPGATLEENLDRIAAGKVAMALDAPQLQGGDFELEGSVKIHGWAHAKDGIEAVLVTLDGCHQHEALRPISRPDLLGDYDREVALDSGFTSLLLDDECGPGSHSLTVVALGHNGEAIGVTCEFLKRPESPGAEARPTRREDLAKPRRRDPERGQNALEERALLAEASAAESRAEARLVHEHQRSFGRAWRQLEAKAQGFDTVQGELEQRTAEVEQVKDELQRCAVEADLARGELQRRAAQANQARGELSGVRRELEAVREGLNATREELAEQVALLDRLERSASWRITRPLRSVKRLFGRRPAV